MPANQFYSYTPNTFTNTLTTTCTGASAIWPISQDHYIINDTLVYNSMPVKKKVYSNFPFKKSPYLSLSAQLQGDFDKFTSNVRKELFSD